MLQPIIAALWLLHAGQAEPASEPKAPPSWEDVYYKRPAFAQGWKYIVIHHSATSAGSARSFDRYHEQQGYGGLAYHFVIGNGKGSRDGQVEEGFRWKRAMSGTHSTVNAWYHNIFGIGICLVGDFQKARPTAKQLEALDRLVATLAARYEIPPENIIAHKEVPWGEVQFDSEKMTVNFTAGKHEQTSCPGKNLSIEALRRRIRAQLALRPGREAGGER
jgi:N-acetyl-anhydromuramyl-L-alanine amidase AmpD